MTTLVNSTMISIIRRVTPTIIANDIIGVQPMTGPIGAIFSLRSKYNQRRIKLTNDHYRVFVRLNNRKKTQAIPDINAAKYPRLSLPLGSLNDNINCLTWCAEQFGKCGYIEDSGTIWFANDNDMLFYKLRWM